MKRTVFYGLLMTFIGSLVIYAVIKNDLLESPLKKLLRFLGADETNKSLNRICSKSSKNLVEFYKKTGPDYKYNIANKGSKTILKITDRLFTDPEKIEWGSEIFNFIFENGALVFLFVLLILLVLLMIPFTCCICCRVCICIPKGCLANYRYYIYACLLLCLGVIISCCVGFSKNSGISHGVYGFLCSFLKIGHHILNGDDYRVQPFWSGLTPIVGTLNNTIVNISNLAAIVDDTNTKFNNLQEIFLNFNNSLDEEYEFRNQTNISNPDPDNDTPIIPEYINEYGPKDRPETSLGYIYEELSRFEDLSFGMFGFVINIISLSEETRNSVISNINKVIKSLDEGVSSIDKVIGEGIGSIDDVLDHALDGIVRTFMNVLFAINLVLIILVALALVCLLFRKKGHCCLCFSWFFLYNFMFLTIILGLLFLLIGLFFQNVSIGILSFLQNIKDKVSSDFPKTARDILDSCFNGDGLLTNSNFFPEDFNTTVVELIYDLEDTLKKDIQDLQTYEFKSINSAKKDYEKFKNNPIVYIPELQNSLKKILKYIDSNEEGTVVDPETHFEDLWVLDKNECPDESYVSPSESNIINNLKTRQLLFTSTTKSCLVITEWDYESITNRYKEVRSTDGSNIQEVAGKYYTSITECLASYNSNIKEMVNKTDDFNESFEYLRDNSILIFDNVLKFIKPLKKTYTEIVGDGSIFSLLNCNFMKRDFNKLFQEIYEEFGASFRTTSDIFLTVCFFQMVMTFLLLFIIAAIRKDDNSTNNFEGNSDYALKDVKEEKLTDD